MRITHNQINANHMGQVADMVGLACGTLKHVFYKTFQSGPDVGKVSNVYLIGDAGGVTAAFTQGTGVPAPASVSSVYSTASELLGNDARLNDDVGNIVIGTGNYAQFVSLAAAITLSSPAVLYAVRDTGAVYGVYCWDSTYLIAVTGVSMTAGVVLSDYPAAKGISFSGFATPSLVF